MGAVLFLHETQIDNADLHAACTAKKAARGKVLSQFLMLCDEKVAQRKETSNLMWRQTEEMSREKKVLMSSCMQLIPCYLKKNYPSRSSRRQIV